MYTFEKRRRELVAKGELTYEVRMSIPGGSYLNIHERHKNGGGTTVSSIRFDCPYSEPLTEILVGILKGVVVLPETLPEVLRGLADDLEKRGVT